MPGKKGGGGGGGGGPKGGATNGPDLIIGNRKDNVIDALGGDDKVIAGDGDDLVHGGDGDDELYGGRGDDELYGDADDDFLAGNVGSDLLDGGEGHDIASYTGDPPTSGGPGGDGGYLFEATGPGAYTVTGGGYTDMLISIEEIWGSNHNDIFLGGDGAEVFDGRLGNDVFTGGDGGDTFIFWSNAGNDVITDFDASDGDRIDLSGSTDLEMIDLDTNEDGNIDDADDHVTLVGADLVIDFGAAAGFAAGENTLTLEDVSGLTTGDFIFA